MTTTSDKFESERSRAAVAVACLQWLQCTGPSIELRPSRITPPDVAELLRNSPSIVSPIHDHEPPHPLWDQWIDG
jgi:hypothetical protein